VSRRLLKNRRLFYVILSLALLTGFIIILINSPIIRAKGSDDCLTCHDDKDLTMEKNGKKISIYVSSSDFKHSVHKVIECIDCHINYNADNLPHNPKKSDVDCKSCHDNIKASSDNVHNNVKCSQCHTKHNILPAREYGKDQTSNCLACHNNKNVQAFMSSTHYKKNVKCDDCHQGGHMTKKLIKSESLTICGKCHTTNQMLGNNGVHQVALKSGNKNAPTCVDCHGSHQILASKMSIESQSCLKCHLDEKLFPGDTKGSAKFVSQYKTSIHSSIQKDGKPAAGCTDCHGNHMIENPKNPESSTSKARSLETCGKCHTDIVAKFKNSKHGQELLKKNPKAPSCTDCHGEHSIQSTLKSDEFSKLNQVELCLRCHQEQKLPHKNYKGEEVLISNYKDSYHYKALKEGKNAATCADCHGSHEMNKADDPNSRIYRKNIPKTCGQSNCHVKELNEYTGSIHEVSLTQKNSPDAPNCNTCHGNHQIAKNNDVQNRISNSKGLVQLCSDCHNSVELTKKYNIPTGRTESYMNSFHGLAIRGGSKVAANCESCHSHHNIRPSSDSLSTISKKNLPQTCGKCHPGANQTLFNTPIHITASLNESPLLFWLSRFYIILIIVTIGGMALHNLFDLLKKMKNKNNKNDSENEEKEKDVSGKG